MTRPSRLAMYCAGAALMALAVSVVVLDALPGLDALSRPASRRAVLIVGALGALEVFALLWLCIEWIGLLA